MVGRMRYSLPLSPSLVRKFDALGEELDVRVLGSAAGGRATDSRFRLYRPVRPRRLDGLAFYALLPFRVARSCATSAPTPSSRKAGRRPRSSSSVAGSRGCRRA